MAKFSVILPAAGKSSRFRDKNYKKPFAPLADRAVWLHAAERFLNRSDVIQTQIVIDAEDDEMFRMKFGANVAILGIEVVHGGKDRSDSVMAALTHVSDQADFVAIHDAARPCLVDAWVDEVFAAAKKGDAAILATPVTSTLKRVKNGVIDETVDRSGVWQAQTPQVFRRQLLIDAYAKRGNVSATDDAQLVERLGVKVAVVTGSPLNVKITTREDLKFAEAALKALPKPNLAGPLHPFADDDKWR